MQKYSELLLLKQDVRELTSGFKSFVTDTQARDRRNFEAFVHARCTHAVLRSIPFFRFWYEWRWKKELELLMKQ